MIRHPEHSGVAFSEAKDGNLRERRARDSLSEHLGISAGWATVTQVHGNSVIMVDQPGDHGEADALWTTDIRLPVAVLTADCYGVVLGSDRSIGVAHAGWRGVDSGVVPALRSSMDEAGFAPSWAAIGPGIGVCCFEVGPEVAEKFPRYVGQTTWATESVDLVEALTDQIDDLPTTVLGRCTHSDSGWFSYRKDGSPQRLATIGWLP